MRRLYRFEYSCFARKVQMVLDLLGLAYEIVEVPYGDRSALVAASGGRVQVPLLVEDGEAIAESRAICARLLERHDGERLVPAAIEGPVWAYADWIDGPLEDLLFRIASPGIRRRFERPADAALFTFVKERKFGAGCVEAWERDASALVAEARAMLAPTVRTLARSPFLFGTAPSLADAALYGQMVMLAGADPQLPARLDERLATWMARLEERRPVAS